MSREKKVLYASIMGVLLLLVTAAQNRADAQDTQLQIDNTPAVSF